MFPKRPKTGAASCNPAWGSINMSQEEEDLILRMHSLVGERWDLIAGRIPGRSAEEIQRYWILKHGPANR